MPTLSNWFPSCTLRESVKYFLFICETHLECPNNFDCVFARSQKTIVALPCSYWAPLAIDWTWYPWDWTYGPANRPCFEAVRLFSWSNSCYRRRYFLDRGQFWCPIATFWDLIWARRPLCSARLFLTPYRWRVWGEARLILWQSPWFHWAWRNRGTSSPYTESLWPSVRLLRGFGVGHRGYSGYHCRHFWSEISESINRLHWLQLWSICQVRSRC